MNVPRYAALAARLLKRPMIEIEPDDAARERSLGTIERALAQRRRRQLRRQAMLGVLAIAACVLVWLGADLLLSATNESDDSLVTVIASARGSGATLLTADGEANLGSDVVLAAGGRVSTALGGGADLELSTGSHLRVEDSSSVVIQRHDTMQRFTLATGALHAKVAKLHQGERFIVDTPDAQVEVRGTEFRLSVVEADRACENGELTRLEVSEGVVEVRAAGHVVRVAAGQHWPEACRTRDRTADEPHEPAASEGEATTPASAAPVAGREPSSGSRAVRAPQPPEQPAEPSSLLREQSDLFARAVHAKRRGDTLAALRSYQELLDRYPSGPLAENARVARMRLLAGSDPARGRLEAQRYLERYPRGFARAEAERLARSE